MPDKLIYQINIYTTLFNLVGPVWTSYLVWCFATSLSERSIQGPWYSWRYWFGEARRATSVLPAGVSSSNHHNQRCFRGALFPTQLWTVYRGSGHVGPPHGHKRRSFLRRRAGLRGAWEWINTLQQEQFLKHCACKFQGRLAILRTSLNSYPTNSQKLYQFARPLPRACQITSLVYLFQQFL